MKALLLLTSSLLLAIPSAVAQDNNQPPPAVQGQTSDHAHRGDNRAPRAEQHDPHGPGEMGGPGGPDGRLLPPGTWWKNPDVVTRISLQPDQVKKIDDLFLQSRVQLIHMHASLEEEELLLQPLLNANPVDQPKALAQIGKIADTRADLEKANAKMLLSIRAVLTADQWTKLQQSAPHGGPHGQPGPAMAPRGDGSNARKNGPPPPGE